MLEKVKAEVKELHDWFTDWYNGKIENNEKVLERFADVMHKDFNLISPNADFIKREDIVIMIKQSYLSKSLESGFIIAVENTEIKHQSSDYILATYNEIQFENNVKTKRLSTVLFFKNESKKNGLEWVHVHETWIN